MSQYHLSSYPVFPSLAGVVITPKEAYPSPIDIPEGRWAVYEVTLPSMPEETVIVAFNRLSDRISLSHQVMTFVPASWNIPQDLVVYAVEDTSNRPSPYPASFNMSVSSTDMNYDGQPIRDYNVTIEDNDNGKKTALSNAQFLLCIYNSSCTQMMRFILDLLLGGRQTMNMAVHQHCSP